MTAIKKLQLVHPAPAESAATPVQPAHDAAGSPAPAAGAATENRPMNTASTASASASPSRIQLKWLANVALPLLTFGVVLAVWSFISLKITSDIPAPTVAWQRAIELFSDPFYQKGPNDMGIGWQVLYSLGRVLGGFALAVLVGIPVGFMMGASETVNRAVYPLVQVLRPVSPLAWLPIGLLLFKAVDPSALFVIFITSIWPVIVNTAAGVKAIPQDYMNVARVLQLGKLEITRRILIPGALPHIITGMRLSLGVAWMVIVAAEMLTGGIGIGFFVWDEWNNLNVASIIVAIGVIGVVGIALEAAMNLVQNRLDYTRR